MKYFIGADLGTSALKLVLTDSNRNIISSTTKAYDVSYPHPGWSEQNPSDWWEAFADGIDELTRGFDKSLISAIGVAGQMHGLVILDKDDNVIRPAILWNDNRTGRETEYLNTQIGKKKLTELTANIAFAGFTAPKLLWLINNEKDNFDKISKIMLPKDYINYRLTGVHSTDYSDASGTLMLDVKNKRWSEDMLKICGVKPEQMPKLFESYDPVGTLLPEIADKLGLCASTVVAAGAGDNAGAAIGTGTTGDGRCNISLGTSGTIFISSSNFSVDENNALHSFCHADGAYHLLGCILSAASCNKWFCDEILNTENYSLEQEKITDEMLANTDVFFLPYLMGERSPINDTDATGLFIGLRPNTKRQDMLLAVLEGVAFAIRDNIEVARKAGINIKSSTVCGGGAKSMLWLKILANVLNITLEIPQKETGPDYGSALLAMAASGNEGIQNNTGIKIKATIDPDNQLCKLYDEKYKRFQNIYPAVKELYKKIKR